MNLREFDLEHDYDGLINPFDIDALAEPDFLDKHLGMLQHVDLLDEADFVHEEAMFTVDVGCEDHIGEVMLESMELVFDTVFSWN